MEDNLDLAAGAGAERPWPSAGLCPAVEDDVPWTGIRPRQNQNKKRRQKRGGRADAGREANRQGAGSESSEKLNVVTRAPGPNVCLMKAAGLHGET